MFFKLSSLCQRSADGPGVRSSLRIPAAGASRIRQRRLVGVSRQSGAPAVHVDTRASRVRARLAAEVEGDATGLSWLDNLRGESCINVRKLAKPVVVQPDQRAWSTPIAMEAGHPRRPAGADSVAFATSPGSRRPARPGCPRFDGKNLRFPLRTWRSGSILLLILLEFH